MAYIEGRPLRDFSKSSKRQTGKQTARVIRKIALAMAEAHEHDVIHRDLKPANVMIDKKNEPVVMDFGLARRTADMEEKLTHTGTVIGTPAYMSPEQVDGDNANVGPPADIYSLGVMFYELLTGELPFQGSLMSILKQISMKDPRPPVELHGDIDPFLQDLCLKMLAKEASDRPASMADVAKSLSDWLQGLHSPTDESGMLETSRVPGQRKRKKKAEQVEATEPITVPGEPRFDPAPEEFAVSDPDEGLSETQPRAQKPAPPKNRSLLITAGLGGIALLAGVVFFLTLGGKYDVKITVDDPSITLNVDGDDVIIDGVGSEIRLSAGAHTLRMERDGLEAELKEFTVRKDGKNLSSTWQLWMAASRSRTTVPVRGIPVSHPMSCLLGTTSRADSSGIGISRRVREHRSQMCRDRINTERCRIPMIQSGAGKAHPRHMPRKRLSCWTAWTMNSRYRQP